MKPLWLLVLVGLAITSVSAASKMNHKKATADSSKKQIEEIEMKIASLLEKEAELENEIDAMENEEEEEEQADEENEIVPDELEEEEEEEEDPLDDQPPYEGEDERNNRDPCLELYCGAGRTCVVTDEGEGECVCVNACEEEFDRRRRVCSNRNETWMSDCELYRQRCLCQEGDESCRNPEYSRAYIDYYGECQDAPDCGEEELEDFPRRMSEWLFNIMRDMADRERLSQHYTQLEREAEKDPKKQWSYSVVWKWCDLDSHPKDKAVSRHELFPIRAPLYTLETCIGTFLDSCDVNNDDSITLQEWATCTKLSAGDVEKMEDFCEDIRGD